jgi:hypothetical protein
MGGIRMEMWRCIIDLRSSWPGNHFFDGFIAGQFKLAGDSKATNQKNADGGDTGSEEDDNASPNLHPFYPHIS